MAKLSLSKSWDQTKASIARDARLHTAVALAFMVLPVVIAGTVDPTFVTGGGKPSGATGIVVLVIGLLGLVGRIAIADLALRTSTVDAAIRHALRRTPAAAGAFLVFLTPVVLLLAPFLPAVTASPENPPPGPLLASTAVVLAAFVVGVRLVLLLVPTAAAENGGPIALLKRGWALSRGSWWRLAAFILLFAIASFIASRSVIFVLGGLLGVLLGPIEPMSVSALILALFAAVVTALFTTIATIMLARIYAQLSAGQPSVPEVSRES